MAAQVKVTFKQDLTEPVKIRHYEGVVFTGDDCGNLIKVALFDGGTPYSGGGTVSATAVLADGTTFPLTQGSITGNMVSVPLEAGALVVSGLMGLYVKISGNGIICTVLNAIFTVQVTDTGRVPAATVTTVNELVQEIKDAQNSIPADLTNLLAAVAPTFSTTTAYSAGAYVWQGGKLYRFTAAHPAGTWTGTDAVEVALGNDVADLKSAFANVEDTIVGNIDDGLNLYVQGENTYGSYWTYKGGSATGTGKVCQTGFMPVTPGRKYTYSGLTSTGSAPHSLFFDASKQYLSGSAFKQKVGINTITAPIGAAFVSFSVLGDDDATFRFISPLGVAAKGDVAHVDEMWREAFETGNLYKEVAFEYGGFSNTDVNNDSPTTPTIRSVDDIDFSGYTSVTIEMDEGYQIIRLDRTGSAPYDMTSWATAGYTFGIAANTLYRFGVQKTGGGAISAADASHIKFKVAEINVPGFNEMKADLHQVVDREPTYVILDFDADIASLSDNRVTLVHDTYGYNFSFVGISDPDITKTLIEMGCDLSIYSNAAGYLPSTSTINSTDPADIAAWDAYVAEVLGRYNAAGFYNQVCWSCQGMNFGSALETALRKYGFKMARGNQVGETNSIYIDGFNDDSFRVGCYQIYSDHPDLALQQVTNAVNNKKDICIFTHSLVDTLVNSYDCTVAAYTTLLDGLKAKEAAGQVKVVTFREYYKMHCWKSSYEYDYNRIFKTIWHE